jgi:hypothetical protein
MAYYEELGMMITKIVEKIANGNQKLLRHIAYDSYKPMDNTSPNGTVQPDVNGVELIYNPNRLDRDDYKNRINPVFKLPDAEKTARIFININCTDAMPNSTSNRYFDIYFNIDIIFHVKTQLVEGNLRHYIIANEIDKMFNGQFIDGLSIGEIVTGGMKVTRASDEFLVATLKYKFLQVGNLGCGK